MANVLESFLAGREARRQQDIADQTNAMRAFIAERGGDIYRGDQTALGQLAGMGPEGLQTAFDVQGSLDARAADAANNARAGVLADRQDQQWAWTVDDRKAGEAAALNEQQQAELQSALDGAAAFYEKGDEAGYNEWIAGLGEDPAQFPFEQFPAIARQFGIELTSQGNPADRYRVVGSTLYDLQAEGGPAIVGQGAMQEETIFGPDGKPLIVRGGPGAGVKFTEGQSKDNVYATRAEGALAALDPVANELTSVVNRAVEFDPTGLARGLQGDQYQIAKQAADEFLQAILRKDTGAAITAQEQELYGKTYLPQPGDGPAVLEAKRQARIRAIEAMKAGMNIDQITATERALVNAAERAGVSPQDGYMGAPPNAAPEAPRRLKYDPATGEFK